MLKTILITCGGGLQGETLIKELDELEEVSIHVCDIYEQNIVRYLTPFYTVSPKVSNEKNYEDFLLNYATENKIDYIIPSTVYDLVPLSKLKDKITAHVAVSNENFLKIALNKRKTYQWLASKEIPTFNILATTEIASHFPVIGKEEENFGGKGIVVINNIEDLEKIPAEKLEHLVWTVYLTNVEEFSVDFCINFNEEISAPVVRKRERVSGGFSVIMKHVEEYENVEIFDLISKLLPLIQAEGGLGLFNVQILQVGEKLYVSDINPRMGTSAVVGQYVGNNLCAHLLEKSMKRCYGRSNQIRVIRTLEEKIVPQLSLTHVKGIVFDLDDTLIDHKNWIKHKLIQTADAFKNEIADKNQFIDYAYLLVDEGKSFILFDEICRYFKMEDVKVSMIDFYRNYVPTTISVYNDVADSLKYISEKYTLAILTDNPVKGQQQKISVFPFSHFFNEVIYTNEFGAEKPASKAFLKACKKMNLSPDNTVMVGDNFHRDIKGALNAGFAFAFQIKRRDTLFNTSSAHYTLAEKQNFLAIENLKELAWYL